MKYVGESDICNFFKMTDGSAVKLNSFITKYEV